MSKNCNPILIHLSDFMRLPEHMRGINDAGEVVVMSGDGRMVVAHVLRK